MSIEAVFQELPPVLKVENLISILCVGRNTAYELVRSGQIRSIRIGTTYRIPKDAVVEFIQKSSGNIYFDSYIPHSVV